MLLPVYRKLYGSRGILLIALGYFLTPVITQRMQFHKYYRAQ